MNADEIVRALRCSAEECSLTGACIRLDDGQLCKDINCQYMQERYETSAGNTGFDDMLSVAADLIESLQAQLAEITEKPELTSPVRYYTDGKPYVQIGGVELHDHPVTEACARLDRYEKYIIPHLQAQLDAAIAGQETLQWALAKSQRREKAAVEDLSTYKDCGFCVHIQDQQYCYKNCQRHVDVDNFRTHPCWQWRGPQEAEEGVTENG